MAFKGKSTIELRNAETGELEFKTEDENMVTNAVYNLINHHYDLFYDNTCWNEKPWWPMSPILKQCYSGILLFSGNLTEDVENIIAPADVKQIGYAQNQYTGANPERGNLNVSESKEINDGKGYRFVWDFATDKANGTIRSVALTSLAGGKIGQYGQADYTEQGGDKASAISALGPYVAGNLINKYGFVTTSSDISNVARTFVSYSLRLGKCTPIGFFKDANTCTFARYGTSPYYLTNMMNFVEQKYERVSMSIFENKLIKVIATEKSVTSNKKFCSPLELFTDGDKIYSVAVTGTNTFDFIVIDGATLEIEKEETFTLQDVQFMTYNYPSGNAYNYYHDTYYYNGYFYIRCASQYSVIKNGSTDYKLYDKYYKINKDDLSDYTLIDFSLQDSSSRSFFEFEGLLGLALNNYYGYDNLNCRVLFPDGTVLWKTVFSGGFPIKNKFLKKPTVMGKSIRVWNRYGDPYDDLRVSVYSPFLSTINNLSTPVVKNETQTMKVTYEITEI